MQAFGLVAALFIGSWLIRMGGPGLILIGVADNSVIPLTGSMDVLTMWLAASHRDIWPYYAVMATVGAVLGGYITYYLGRKGGKEAIEHRFKKQRAEKLFKRFDKWGFRTIAITALLPPPFPLVPVLLAAGGLQYSKKKFLGALTLGRSVRYFLVAGIGSLYARPITAFFTRYYKLAVLILVGFAVIGGVLAILEYLRLRHKDGQHAAVSPSRAA